VAHSKREGPVRVARATRAEIAENRWNIRRKKLRGVRRADVKPFGLCRMMLCGNIRRGTAWPCANADANR
jgi:hypothetical protein